MTVITGYSRLGQAKLQPFRPSTTKIFRFSGYSTINDFQQVSTKIQSKLKLSSDAVEAKYLLQPCHFWQQVGDAVKVKYHSILSLVEAIPRFSF